MDKGDMGQGGTPAPGEEAAPTGAVILRRAADRLKVYGWTQGAHARDTEGRVCRITAPEAAYWSAYGAIMREMANAGLIEAGGDDKAVQTSTLWAVVTREAVRYRRAYNGVHPLFDINDDPARTVHGMIDFLLDCAERLETEEHKETAR